MSYKIVDKAGNEITNPDYTKGRITSTDSQTMTMVYETWAEKPDLDTDGNVIVHGPKPTVEEQLSTIQEAIAELYEATLSE